MRAVRAVSCLVLLLAPGVAQASKLDAVERLLANGKCAEAVARVDDWEAHGGLGDEAADLSRVRVDAAACVAKATDSIEGWSAFLQRFPDAPAARGAQARVWELAFAAAQAEGTSVAMRRFMERFPGSPQTGEAAKQAEAWDFDDASREATLEAIERFLAKYPSSTLREAAWESVIQKNPGIYLVTAGGKPRLLDAVPVTGDRLTVPVGLAAADSYATVGVNLPGAGRGETSEWWSLRAIVYDEEGDAHLSATAPAAALLGERLGAAPPGPEAGLLTLVRAPGSHIARVATTKAPLAVPGHCGGSGRFAFVLETPGVDVRAFPFSVRCPERLEARSALGDVFAFLDAAEAGDRTLARQLWGALVASPAAGELRGWLALAVGGDPWVEIVERRPAVGDWVVWTTQADGSLLSSWLRADDAGASVLAVRPGWAVVAQGALRTTVSEPDCARLFGSLGATLFCAAGNEPRVFSFDSEPLPWAPPADEVVRAAGFTPPLDTGAVVAVGPRWQGNALCIGWRLRTTVQADVVAPAPTAWLDTLAPSAALGRWLAENAGSSASGASRVDRNAAAIYASFTAP
jgi:hypothetical protein